jgi:hypothetical protein
MKACRLPRHIPSTSMYLSRGVAGGFAHVHGRHGRRGPRSLTRRTIYEETPCDLTCLIMIFVPYTKVRTALSKRYLGQHAATHSNLQYKGLLILSNCGYYCHPRLELPP